MKIKAMYTPYQRSTIIVYIIQMIPYGVTIKACIVTEDGDMKYVDINDLIVDMEDFNEKSTI